MEPIQLLIAIHQQVLRLQEQVTELTAEVKLLRAENERLSHEQQQILEKLLEKSTSPSASIPFRRLTYNIQNLNVTTLSGTLNVGLVTSASEDQVLHHLSGFGVEAEEAPESDPEPDSRQQDVKKEAEPSPEPAGESTSAASPPDSMH